MSMNREKKREMEEWVGGGRDESGGGEKRDVG